MRIDCCVYHDFGAQAEIVEYLPEAWKEYVGEPGSLAWGLGGKDLRMPLPYGSFAPLGYDALAAGLGQSDLGLLTHRTGLLFAADNNAPFGLELCRASNRWTVERWLDVPGSPFLGAIVVPNQYPEEAAAEVRRWASHDRVVAVHLGGNGLSKPFGHPLFHPIYAAAVEAGLPVMIDALGDALIDTLAHSTAGGLPSFAGEYRALAAQSLMTHATSLIAQGVFEKFPGLRVLLAGGGLAWVPSLLWRLDANFGAFGRDTPWLRRLPSEYFVEHVRLTTYRLERPPVAASLHRALRTVEGMDQMICYASGMPAEDADTLAESETLIPPEWHDAVFETNAQSLLGERLGAAT